MHNLVPVGVKAEIGAVIGRFQVDILHDAHRQLLTTICDRHDKVVVFLGVAAVSQSRRNPLDFDCRRLMIQELYPDIIVLPLRDCRTDEEWSEQIDAQLRIVSGPMQKVALYGGRDSCLPHYKGRHKIQELEDPDGIISVSGSMVRSRLSVKAQASREFRAGAIWAASQHFPRVITTVDFAIIDWAKSRVLFAQKPKEDKWRFPGGFSEPSSTSFEHDVRREAMEETELEVGSPEYIGSFNVPDWRYNGNVDKIRTLFFAAPYIFGAPVASDDISEVRWMDFSDVIGSKFDIVPEHRDLLLALSTFIQNKQSTKS